MCSLSLLFRPSYQISSRHATLRFFFLSLLQGAAGVHGADRVWAPRLSLSSSWTSNGIIVLLPVTAGERGREGTENFPEEARRVDDVVVRREVEEGL
jgi:hypothetical protein